MRSTSPTRFLTTAVVVLALAGCAATSRQQGTGEHVDDTVLATRVKAELLKEPVVSALAVKVETAEGVVRLSGFVKTAAERDLAARIAREVKGVKQVKNDILLR